MKIIDGSKVIYSFKPKMEAVEWVKSGEVFKVVTHDCFYEQIQNKYQILEEIDYSKLNPATGPICIEGTETGDILKIKILKIDPTSNGVSITMPNEGTLGYKATKSLLLFTVALN